MGTKIMYQLMNLKHISKRKIKQCKRKLKICCENELEVEMRQGEEREREIN